MPQIVTERLRLSVAERAFDACEYCRLPDAVAAHRHEADHILPRKHGGETQFENLAFSCWRCNRHKGSDVGSFDFEVDGTLTRFFNPRIDAWPEHFRIDAADIIALTAEARVTLKILRINGKDRGEERREMLTAGLYG